MAGGTPHSCGSKPVQFKVLPDKSGVPAVMMQSDFNAKAQRRRGAKAETEIRFRKTKALFNGRLWRQSDPVTLHVFAPLRLCVKELNSRDTTKGRAPGCAPSHSRSRSLFWTNPYARRKVKSMKKDRRSRLCGTLAGVGLGGSAR
jgi:hypothetical protein